MAEKRKAQIDTPFEHCAYGPKVSGSAASRIAPNINVKNVRPAGNIKQNLTGTTSIIITGKK